MNLHDFLSSVDWSKVQRVHTAQQGNFYTFSVIAGKQKRMITIGVGPDTTTLTVSDLKGHILNHVVQQGSEMVYYKPKAGTEAQMAALGDLAPVHIVSLAQDSGFGERGI
ncbi:Uncharacterised protein [uncultured archaeon]|nr:Uncharacterised protein [uncultured archaeon]